MKFNKVLEELMSSVKAGEKRKEVNLKKRLKRSHDTGFTDISGTSDTSGFGSTCLGPNVKGVRNDGSSKI